MGYFRYGYGTTESAGNLKSATAAITAVRAVRAVQ